MDVSCFVDLALGNMLKYKGWEGGYINEEGIYLNEVMDNKIKLFNSRFVSYKLINPENKVIEFTSIPKLSKEINISQSQIYKILKGKSEWKGWKKYA